MHGSHRQRRTFVARFCLFFIIGLLGACATPMPTAEAPDWIATNGSSPRYPTGRYLTGFAQLPEAPGAIDSAKQQATADLARQISVQIESSVVDVTREKQGRLDTELTSQIRATADIRLQGVRFETYAQGRRVWVLATLERLPAAVARRKERDRALVMTRQCLLDAEKEEQTGRSSQALDAYRSCRTPLDEALEHEAVAAALVKGGLLEDSEKTPIARYLSQIQTRIRAIPHEDAQSIRSAASRLAEQLARGGVGRGRNLQVAPFLYHSRDISSPFGREIAQSLESAIGRSTAASGASDALVVRGTYREDGDKIQLRATAKEAGTGSLIASAEIDLARSAISKDLPLRPPNFANFAEDADKLAGGEVVSGDLRVEVQTNKGTRGLVYDEGEELALFVRVNQRAWIRLIYVLTNGEHVPIDQAYYIDDTKVNQLVEYPERFEIVPPFGVEMIHVMAYTDRPPDLVTRPSRVAGQDYFVISDGVDQVVRHRGIARKRKQEVAEQTLQLTTMSRARP